MSLGKYWIANKKSSLIRKIVHLRKGLPLNYLKHVGIVNKNDKSKRRDLIIDKVKSLVSALVNYIDVDAAADNLGRKFMHDAMPPLYSQEEARHSSKYDGDFMRNGRVFNRYKLRKFPKFFSD